MGDWATVRLGDMCKITKTKHHGEPLPYVGMEHVESGTGRLTFDATVCNVKSSTFRFNRTQLLYGRLRPYLNKVLLPDFDGHCSTEIFPIECSPGLDRRFLYHWLTGETTVRRIDRTSTGARMPRANVNAILDFDIHLPPLPEQKRIVAILDEAFSAIATATANAEKNLANARELFENQLNAEFEQGLNEWKTAKFGNLCNFVRGPFGGSLKKSCFVASGFAVYEQQHAINDQFDQVRYYIDDRKFSEMSRFELRPGDLIMSCSGTMGRVAIAPQELRKGIINQALLKLTPSLDLFGEFLKLWMQSNSFQEQLSIHSKGAAIKNVASVKVLKEISAPFPTIEEQHALVEKLHDFESEAETLHVFSLRRVTLLAELKQSILHKAFTGELTADPQSADRSLSETGL